MIEGDDFFKELFYNEIMGFNQLIQGNIHWSLFFVCPPASHICLLKIYVHSNGKLKDK